MAKNKPKFLVKKKDKLYSGTPGSKEESDNYHDVALKLSLDMYELTNRLPRHEYLSAMAKYFKKRPGVIDAEAGSYKPHQSMAIKMYLMSDIVKVLQAVSEQANVKPDDMNINLEFVDKYRHGKGQPIAISVGIHKRLDKSKAEVVHRLCMIHMQELLRSFHEEHPGIAIADDEGRDILTGANTFKKDKDVEIDDETAKALERLDWDRTSRGEA